VPRYFIVLAWAAAVVGAWGVTYLWERHRRLAAAACLGGALLANVAALSVENTDPRFIERELLAWVLAHPSERIHTDIETFNRAAFFFRFANATLDQVSTDRPPTGATFFYSPDRVASCGAAARCRDRVADFRPGAAWKAQQTVEGEATIVGKMLRAIGLDRRLPPDIAQRLMMPGGRATIYRVQHAEPSS
jgi:hypothetical protein